MSLEIVFYLRGGGIPFDKPLSTSSTLFHGPLALSFPMKEAFQQKKYSVSGMGAKNRP